MTATKPQRNTSSAPRPKKPAPPCTQSLGDLLKDAGMDKPKKTK